MRKDRLKILATLVVKNHQDFSMFGWVREIAVVHDGEINCGSTGCLAALTVAEFHPHLWEDYQDAFKWLRQHNEMVPNNGHIKQSAMKLLDLTRTEADRLFYASNWPAKYAGEYDDAGTTLEMAKVAARYLRYLARP